MRSITHLAMIFVGLGGCAGATAEAPLTMKLGGDRASTTKVLRQHQYCHQELPPGRYENYPRCERLGPEWGESWVTAVFDKETLVEIRRWERFADDGRATERWNQLVADRMKLSPVSDEAMATLRASGLLQAGTRAMKAYRDGDLVIGVYLLTPTPPEDASILERIVSLPRK
ncbi:MAG: hypothetical protein NT062_12750 [Proteobacteria bacterium]|nr:hypothetical protein [Pseudomonadota bacterium]